MTHYRLLVASAVMAAAASAPATPALKVWSIQPNRLDYTLTSRVASQPAPVLSFNHWCGRTVFARTGEMLGEYRLLRFEPRTETVFNPSINSSQAKPSGTAWLQGPDGREVRMDMNKPGLLPGWCAYIASVPDGGFHLVRPGDTLRAPDGSLVVIGAITEKAVSAATNGISLTLPAATAEEQAAVVKVWRERARLAEEDRRLAEQKRKREIEAHDKEIAESLAVATPVRRFTQQGGPSAQLNIGREIRYPTEFRIAPGSVAVGSGGVLTTDPIVYPTRWETRMTGFSIQADQ